VTEKSRVAAEFCTVKALVADALLRLASQTVSESVCGPFHSLVVSSGTWRELASCCSSSTPSRSSRMCWRLYRVLSDALAIRFTVPETVAPAAGATMVAVGRVTSWMESVSGTALVV
jgi:hypothetical protein